ncbi:MAG: hypothetical protein HOP23_06180 [Methylococcaceae bacterium]|nr:hypothetical protein [Methylococcaceae bacterium]
MKRNSNFYKTVNLSHQDVNHKIAFHEAGHAAAIYIGNRQKGLPPVYFNIWLSSSTDDFASYPLTIVGNIDGGRLIHTLPSSVEEATTGFSSTEKAAYLCAFEADMINLLVGPVAEAKYSALRHGELMNPLLVQANSLHRYGGSSDLESVYEYLGCFLLSETLKEQKMAQLLMAAIRFVNDRENWWSICALADHIACQDQTVFEYHQIIDVLESANPA